jgi:hypothetical protein
MEKTNPEIQIPVVVRRIVDPEQFKEEEVKPVEITATRISIINHLPDTYLVVPLDESLPNLDGDRVREAGYTETHAKGMVILYFGKDKILAEEVWQKVISRANLGIKVVLVLNDSGTDIIIGR